MKDKNVLYIIISLSISILLVLSFTLQKYYFTALEELYIMIYDWEYVLPVIAEPGGFSRIIGSLCTQFFIYPWTGPVITTLSYSIIVISISRIAHFRHSALWTASIGMLPCLFLMLCLEISAFEYQGIISLMLSVLFTMIYVISFADLKPIKRTITGTIFSLLLYYLAGPAALSMTISILIYDIYKYKINGLLDCICSLSVIILGYICYLSELVPTIGEGLLPEMYYDMGSTYFMMLYAMISVPLCMIIILIFKDKHKESHHNLRQVIISLVVISLQLLVFFHLYRTIHSTSNYVNAQQRYYARHSHWDAIINMPYNGSPTPYTSYIFLALAHKGILTENVNNYHPFISYLFENKPKIKKLDQQIYSDIYYDCDYMGAARHAAFDTDMVTPGKFNPYEIQKLVTINIAYGDYAVAEKLITQLEKTLFYCDWATEQRKFLYNDDLVNNDSVLGPKRRAIPKTNHYLRPKGIQRDLRDIIESNHEQIVASEFYHTFLKLTKQNENK